MAILGGKLGLVRRKHIDWRRVGLVVYDVIFLGITLTLLVIAGVVIWVVCGVWGGCAG